MSELVLETEFQFELGESAEVVYRSLLPELSEKYQRTSASLGLDGSMLWLRIDADDIVSARAALNTWLRLIKIAHELAGVGEAAKVLTSSESL